MIVRLHRPYNSCTWAIELSGNRELVTPEAKQRFHKVLNEECAKRDLVDFPGISTNGGKIRSNGGSTNLSDGDAVQISERTFEINENNTAHRETMKVIAKALADQLKCEFVDDILTKQERIAGRLDSIERFVDARQGDRYCEAYQMARDDLAEIRQALGITKPATKN